MFIELSTKWQLLFMSLVNNDFCIIYQIKYDILIIMLAEIK
jgi:hypothetical protein